MNRLMKDCSVLSQFIAQLGLERADSDQSIYIDPHAVDFKSLLSGPPEVGSQEELADIEYVLDQQSRRTQADMNRSQREVALSVFLFDEVLGSWFTEENVPLTASLFKKVFDDSNLVTKPAGKHWNRRRPPLRDSRVQPAVRVPDRPSYPSGRATRGYLFGVLLAEMVPDLKAELIARGRAIGEYRVIGGVHFKTDVEASQKLGRELANHFFSSLSFLNDFSEAQAELNLVRTAHRCGSTQERHEIDLEIA